MKKNGSVKGYAIYQAPVLSCRWCHHGKDKEGFRVCNNPAVLKVLEREKMIVACREDKDVNHLCAAAQLSAAVLQHNGFDRLEAESIAANTGIPSVSLQRWLQPILDTMYVGSDQIYQSSKKVFLKIL